MSWVSLPLSLDLLMNSFCVPSVTSLLFLLVSVMWCDGVFVSFKKLCRTKKSMRRRPFKKRECILYPLSLSINHFSLNFVWKVSSRMWWGTSMVLFYVKPAYRSVIKRRVNKCNFRVCPRLNEKPLTPPPERMVISFRLLNSALFLLRVTVLPGISTKLSFLSTVTILSLSPVHRLSVALMRFPLLSSEWYSWCSLMVVDGGENQWRNEWVSFMPTCPFLFFFHVSLARCPPLTRFLFVSLEEHRSRRASFFTKSVGGVWWSAVGLSRIRLSGIVEWKWRPSSSLKTHAGVSSSLSVEDVVVVLQCRSKWVLVGSSFASVRLEQSHPKK